jgi:hypothetical protein
MPETPGTTPAAEPLRLETCPSCGYALNGLPDEGLCPECGKYYDQYTVVLHGWSTGSKADVATARPWVIVGWTGLVIWLIWRAVRDGGRDPVSLGVAVATVFFIARGLWRRWSNEMPGLTQVRLNRDGCRQLESNRSVILPAPAPWSEVRHVDLDLRGKGMVWLRIRCRTPLWRSAIIPVEAMLKCTPEQADELRERIDEWRNAARAS